MSKTPNYQLTRNVCCGSNFTCEKNAEKCPSHKLKTSPTLGLKHSSMYDNNLKLHCSHRPLTPNASLKPTTPTMAKSVSLTIMKAATPKSTTLKPSTATVKPATPKSTALKPSTATVKPTQTKASTSLSKTSTSTKTTATAAKPTTPQPHFTQANRNPGSISYCIACGRNFTLDLRPAMTHCGHLICMICALDAVKPYGGFCPFCKVYLTRRQIIPFNY